MRRGPNEAKTQQARRLRQNSAIAESRLWNRRLAWMAAAIRPLPASRERWRSRPAHVSPAGLSFGTGKFMPPILSLEKISKRFSAIIVADGIDLALADGEALGIIGPNGAGKSTLFGIISGAIAPDAGRVLFAGADITGLPPPRRCRIGIARSFQIPQPFGA